MDYETMLMNQSSANSAFNANESAINRAWQEYMSGTSHQRETADLIAAGLNPVLSANSGSTWNAVSNASADPSSIAALSNIATTRMNNETNLQMATISAEAAKAAANATAGATQAAASMNSAATIYAANKAYETATEAAMINKGSSWAGMVDKYLGNSAFNAAKAVGNAISGIFGVDRSAYTGY